MRKFMFFLAALALMGVVAWGIMSARRNDSGAGSHQGAVSGDGKPAPITVDANGRLWVHDAVGLVDDAAFTPATSLVNVVAAEFDDASPDSVDEGDAGALRMSANRNLYVTLRDAAGNERGVNIDASNQLGVVEANSATIAGDTTAIETAIQIIDDWDATHDGAAPTDGVTIMATWDSTLPTATANDGDAMRVLGDAYGRIRTGWESDRIQGSIQSADASSTEAVIIAGVSAKKIAVLWIKVHCDVALDVTLEDEDDNVLDVAYCAAKGGYTWTFSAESPMVIDTADKNLQVQTSGAGNVSASAGGYYYP